MINVDRAHEIDEEGLSLTDSNGNVVLYVTGGTGSPVGTQAPVPTIYVDDSANLWRKFGPGVNDWVQLGGFNFSKCKLENENLTIPDRQEMLVTGVCIDVNSCLNITDKSSVTVIRGAS